MVMSEERASENPAGPTANETIVALEKSLDPCLLGRVGLHTGGAE